MVQVLKKRWVYHSLIWIGLYVLLSVLDFNSSYSTGSIFSSFQELFIVFIPLVIVTYLGLYAKEKLFDARKYLQYIVAFAIITSLGVAIQEALSIFDGGLNIPLGQKFSNFAIFQLMTIGVQYFKRGIINQYQLQELRAKTVMTELNALKAQINPHFLFNTLNNIYGMNQINPEKGSEMIMELSDVMRYHLEFSKEGQVKLEDEIQLLQSYIKLERLRLRETCDVQIDFEDADERIMISPLLFLPFVENAFKHGTHPTKKCYVHIELKSHSGNLHFIVKNSIIANRKVVKTNIGLQNTKRRLELLFPKKHNLEISVSDEQHLVELSIEI